MARMQKGILGAPRDPSRQMLFSFSAREGEEWPSDSEDSDYQPDSEHEDELRSFKKAKSKKTSKTQLKNKSVIGDHQTKKKKSLRQSLSRPESNEESLSSHTDTLWGVQIPPEVLLLVFQHVVSMTGALPFLYRASKVCVLWNGVSKHPTLWRNVDLSFGWIKSTDETLLNICSSKLTQTQELSLQSWKNLTLTGIQAVAANCRQLESICLSYCTKLNNQAVPLLTDGCPKLSSLDLSFTSTQATQGKIMQQVIEKYGPNFKLFNFSGNKLNGFNYILNAISKHCSNLRTLEVCNATFSNDFATFDIERIQTGCPQLQVLRLSNSKFRAPAASQTLMQASYGFPELEEFSLAMNPATARDFSVAIDARFIQRVLKTSHQLKLLDLRECCSVENVDMTSLAANGLSRLYLSHYMGQALPQALSKWGGCMEEVELAWMKERAMSGVLSSLVEASPLLSSLSLLGTSGVYKHDIEKVLNKCSKLKSLNLQSCRDLPRGMKQAYSTKTLRNLRRDIHVESSV